MGQMSTNSNTNPRRTGFGTRGSYVPQPFGTRGSYVPQLQPFGNHGSSAAGSNRILVKGKGTATTRTPLAASSPTLGQAYTQPLQPTLNSKPAAFGTTATPPAYSSCYTQPLQPTPNPKPAAFGTTATLPAHSYGTVSNRAPTATSCAAAAATRTPAATNQSHRPYTIGAMQGLLGPTANTVQGGAQQQWVQNPQYSTYNVKQPVNYAMPQHARQPLATMQAATTFKPFAPTTFKPFAPPIGTTAGPQPGGFTFAGLGGGLGGGGAVQHGLGGSTRRWGVGLSRPKNGATSTSSTSKPLGNSSNSSSSGAGAPAPTTAASATLSAVFGPSAQRRYLSGPATPTPTVRHNTSGDGMSNSSAFPHDRTLYATAAAQVHGVAKQQPQHYKQANQTNSIAARSSNEIKTPTRHTCPANLIC